MAVSPCAVSARKDVSTMPASPAYEALLHQAAVGRLKPLISLALIKLNYENLA